MDINLKTDLRKILPKDHPILEKLDQYPRTVHVKHTDETLQVFTDLVGLLDDWKRGICDWYEVEECLVSAREEVGHVVS